MSDRTRIYTNGWFASVPEPSNSTSVYTQGWFEESSIVPSTPEDLAATAVSPTSMLLTWIDNSSIENGFRVERSLAGEDDWEVLGSTPSDVTYFFDNTPIPDVGYDYRVVAFNDEGESAPAYVFGVATPVPGLIVTPGPPVIPEPPPRNTLEPLEVSFLSPGSYGVEVGPDGSVIGFKY